MKYGMSTRNNPQAISKVLILNSDTRHKKRPNNCDLYLSWRIIKRVTISIFVQNACTSSNLNMVLGISSNQFPFGSRFEQEQKLRWSTVICRGKTNTQKKNVERTKEEILIGYRNTASDFHCRPRKCAKQYRTFNVSGIIARRNRWPFTCDDWVHQPIILQ